MKKTICAFAIAIAATTVVGCASHEEAAQTQPSIQDKKEEARSAFPAIKPEEVSKITKNGPNYTQEIQLSQQEQNQVITWYNQTRKTVPEGNQSIRAPHASITIYFHSSTAGTINVSLLDDQMLNISNPKQGVGVLGEEQKLWQFLYAVSQEDHPLPAPPQ